MVTDVDLGRGATNGNREGFVVEFEGLAMSAGEAFAQHQLLGEGFGAHVVVPGGDGRGEQRIVVDAVDDDVDAVRNREAGVFAGILDVAHHFTGDTFGHQIGGEGGIEGSQDAVFFGDGVAIG